DSAVKEDLIILRVKDVPARELMERVSKHFDWSWRAEDGGYVLFQSKEQKEREEKAYKEQYLEPLRRTQAQLRTALEDAGARFDEFHEAWKSTRAQFMATEPGTERWGELFEEVRRLANMGTVYSRLAREVFLRITPEQFHQLVETGVIVFALTPTSAQWPVVDELAPIAQEALNELLSLSRGGAEANDILVQFTYGLGGWTPFLDGIRPTATVYAATGGGRLFQSQGVALVGDNSLRWRKPPAHAFAGVTLSSPYLEELLRSAPGRPYAHLAAQLSTDWLKPGSHAMPEEGAARVALTVAEELGVNLISDFFALTHPFGDSLRVRDASLLLDSLFRHGWAVEAGWIAARSPWWAVERSKFIPVDRLKALRDQAHRRGGLGVDELGEFASRHTNAQMLGKLMGDVFRFGLPDLLALRLLHSLTPAQRLRWESGATLPAGDLGASQRKLAWQLLLVGGYGYGWSDFEYPVQNLPYVPGAAVTELLASGLPAETEVRVQRVEAPSVRYYVVGTDGSFPGPVQAVSAGVFTADDEREAAGHVKRMVQPAKREDISVIVQVSREIVGRAGLRLHFFDPNAPFVSADQLPEQVKRAIEEARRRRQGGGGATS
ncbi:MAG: hypothetical protein AB1725_11270, partial [Armatimonadota bacterium]